MISDHLILIALTLTTLIQATIEESKLNLSNTKQALVDKVVGRFGYSSSSLPSSSSSPYNKRWDRDYISSSLSHQLENEINDSRTQAHKSQQDYVCGRAIANKKYKDLLLRDQSYQMSVARAKYRPIEIRMPRIIGGDETTPGEFPWTVSVKLNGQPICGGSLIDKNWILTAAHCVVGYNPKNLTVRLGAYRIKDTSETQTIDSPVSMFIVHKEYSMPRPFSNDIALLKLDEPIEFNDFIIPICLPTEDQVSTSTSTVIVNDYSNNRYETVKEGEDSGGIVISTKMSDNDIAICFNKLEQNYLNSIGLGSINGVPAVAAAAAASEVSTTQLPPKLPLVNLPLPPVPSPVSQSHQASPSSSSGHLFSYGGLLEPILMPANNNNNNNNNKKQHHNKLSASSLGQYQDATELAPDESGSFVASSLANNYDNLQTNTNYIYYPGLSWTDRKESPSIPNTAAADESLIGRKEMVKLNRLPMSKEILHEIVSSGDQLPSLNLNIQQGDFVAMASDLTQSSVGSSSGSSELPSGLPGQYLGNGISPSESSPYNDGNNNNISKRDHRIASLISDRHLIRSAMDEDSDDPTKYSGLSGIVVGWGWIREFDGEDPVNNKGYPSVTLQKVKLPILRNNVCEAWFQSQAKKITLLPSQFCAGFNSGGKDACRGDSGGPMIIEDNSDTGRYKLIGIVSAGIGCARPSLPGLYTRVASFLPWINAQLVRY